MSIKKCTDCKKDLPIESFSINKNKKDGLNYRCKKCQSIYFNVYWKKNRQYYYNKSTDQKKRRKEFIRQQKEKPCTDCKIQYPWYVMEFDHLKNKQFNLSSSTAYSASIKKILKEINNCEIVCRNCHAERTYQNNWTKAPIVEE